MADSIETSDREAEDPREPIRLPVREMRDETKPQCPMCGDMGGPEYWAYCKAATCAMRDEPAPQRTAQEGDLPPLLTDERIHEIVREAARGSALRPVGSTPTSVRIARAIESEVRTAIAAAGGGVPQGLVDAIDAEIGAVQAELAKPNPYPTETSSWNRAVSHGRIDGLVFAQNLLAAAPEAPAQAAPSAGEVERGDVVAFEFYNRATGHAIVDYSVNTHVGNLSAAKGYEARPLVYAAPRQNVLDGSKLIPAWQAREALDELEAAARGDAPFNHQAAAVVRAALSHKEQP